MRSAPCWLVGIRVVVNLLAAVCPWMTQCSLFCTVAKTDQRLHFGTSMPLRVGAFILLFTINSGYEAMALALPPEHLPQVGGVRPCQLMERLLSLAARLKPRQLTTSKREPKPQVPKDFVDSDLARSHVTTARVIKAGRTTP